MVGYKNVKEGKIPLLFLPSDSLVAFEKHEINTDANLFLL